MKSVIKVQELRDLAKGMKIDLVMRKHGTSIIIDCDSEIELQRFVETLQTVSIQVFIDRMCPTRAYVYTRAFADGKVA